MTHIHTGGEFSRREKVTIIFFAPVLKICVVALLTVRKDLKNKKTILVLEQSLFVQIFKETIRWTLKI